MGAARSVRTPCPSPEAAGKSGTLPLHLDPRREKSQLCVDILHRTHGEREDGEAPRGQVFEVLPPVLLGVDDDQVGSKVRDPPDVGVLGATHVREVRALAESSAGNRLATPGRQGLGDRGDQADDPHRYLTSQWYRALPR